MFCSISPKGVGASLSLSPSPASCHVLTNLDSFSKHYPSPVPGVQGFAQTIADLWKPYVHPLDNTTFTTKSGRRYDLDPTHKHWERPLGKDVVIIDVDTRYDPGTGPVLEGKNMNYRTAGRMNHYIYSLIHGYDYKLIHAPEYWYRHQTWVKVPMMMEALKDHKFVVFLDADAIFSEPQMPIEWLLTLWNIHDDILVALAEDIYKKTNLDRQGLLLWNTGFVIAQNSPRTLELFQSWKDCPSDKEFPGCSHWNKKFAHEQAAFGNYLRYKYNTTDELRMIPCLDGNGSQYIPEKEECGGQFVQHLWSSKDVTITDLQQLVATALSRQIKDGDIARMFDALVHPIHV
jgi:nucleotide-diphospho-sugar transferase